MRFRTVSTVHINTICMSFRLHPLSRAFATRCVFDENAQRMSVDGRPKPIKMYALLNETYKCGRALVTRRELHISYKLNLSGGKNFCFLICIFSNLKAWAINIYHAVTCISTLVLPLQRSFDSHVFQSLHFFLQKLFYFFLYFLNYDITFY